MLTDKEKQGIKRFTNAPVGREKYMHSVINEAIALSDPCLSMILDYCFDCLCIPTDLSYKERVVYYQLFILANNG